MRLMQPDGTDDASAKSRHGYDPATGIGTRRCLTTDGRLLRQRNMSSVLMIITGVFSHQALQMTFIQDGHMVEQIAAAVANPALGNAVLPRTSEAGPLGLDAEALYRVYHFVVELSAALEDEVFRSRVVRECLAQLLDYPCSGRLPGHVVVKNSPPIMRDNEEAVQQAEGQRRHSDEIHRRDGCSKRPPIASPPQDSSVLSASSAERFAPKRQSQAFPVRHECAVRPKSNFRQPCRR